MTDETTVDQPTQEVETPDNGLNELVEKLQKQIDERFSGFQSTLDRKITPLESALEELTLSRMSPAEREEFQEEQFKKDNDRLRRENEILKKAQDHPKEVGFLTKFLEAQSLEDQLSLLSSIMGNATGATPTEGTDENPEPEVNLNNPPRKPEQSLAAVLSSGRMTKEAAERLLNANNDRGALVRSRG